MFIKLLPLSIILKENMVIHLIIKYFAKKQVRNIPLTISIVCNSFTNKSIGQFGMVSVPSLPHNDIIIGGKGQLFVNYTGTQTNKNQDFIFVSFKTFILL